VQISIAKAREVSHFVAHSHTHTHIHTRQCVQINIAKAREVYRPVAARGSLVYFLIDNLNALNRVYHYSMANFVYVLGRGMDVCPGGKDESKVGASYKTVRTQ